MVKTLSMTPGAIRLRVKVKRQALKQRAEDIFEALSLTIIPTKLEILLKIMELIESM